MVLPQRDVVSSATYKPFGSICGKSEHPISMSFHVLVLKERVSFEMRTCDNVCEGACHSLESAEGKSGSNSVG
jgi:hypothetical protein